MTEVSVIIPAINEEAVIARAVRSAWESRAAEVIVCDGGSRDATCHIAREHRARVINAPTGRARQQNAGAAVASCRWLCFLHADNWLAPTALPHAQRRLADSGRRWAAFAQRIEAGGLKYRLLEWGNGLRARVLRLPYGDQALLVDRGLFEQLGGFPDVPLMEDVMLGRALSRFGPPEFLPGPLHVSARRWQQRGVVRQTLRNWGTLAAFAWGVPPSQLAGRYPRHDMPGDSPD